MYSRRKTMRRNHKVASRIIGASLTILSAGMAFADHLRLFDSRPYVYQPKLGDPYYGQVFITPSVGMVYGGKFKVSEQSFNNNNIFTGKERIYNEQANSPMGKVAMGYQYKNQRFGVTYSYFSSVFKKSVDSMGVNYETRNSKVDTNNFALEYTYSPYIWEYFKPNLTLGLGASFFAAQFQLGESRPQYGGVKVVPNPKIGLGAEFAHINWFRDNKHSTDFTIGIAAEFYPIRQSFAIGSADSNNKIEINQLPYGNFTFNISGKF